MTTISDHAIRTYRAPTTCPVCSDALITLSVGCPGCGTQLSGHFATCRYCSLSAADLEVLEVFLRSRGNVRDIQAHLGVSYPTARQRLADLLTRMGLAEEGVPSPSNTAEPVDKQTPAAPTPTQTTQVLSELASGRLTVDQAEAALTRDAHPQNRP